MIRTPVFTSPRERRLWLWSLAVVAAIYSTLGLAGTLVGVLREWSLLPAAMMLVMVLTFMAIVGSGLGSGLGGGLRRPPAALEVWVALGVVVVYGMAVLRMGGSPEERTHLFEYGIVALLIHAALAERVRNGRRVRAPAALAVVVAALLGWVDEGIQALLPNRVYDNFDVFSNAVAAVIAIAGSQAVARAAAAVERRRGGGSPC